jgi:hypothetical protein
MFRHRTAIDIDSTKTYDHQISIPAQVLMALAVSIIVLKFYNTQNFKKSTHFAATQNKILHMYIYTYICIPLIHKTATIPIGCETYHLSHYMTNMQLTFHIMQLKP